MLRYARDRADLFRNKVEDCPGGRRRYRSAMPEFTRRNFSKAKTRRRRVLCKDVFYMHRRACSTIYKGKSSIGYFRQTCRPLFYDSSPITFVELARNYTSIFLSYESNELNMNDKFGTELPARTSLVTPFPFKRCTNVELGSLER